MRFVVFLADSDPLLHREGIHTSESQLAALCVKSIRYHHPEAEIVHMTDQTTKQIPDVDAVWRHEWNKGTDGVIRFRMASWAKHFDATPTVSLDSDTLLQGRADAVFADDFDVCLTEKRGGARPFNAGVMFSRCNGFWVDLRDRPKQSSEQSFIVVEETLPIMVSERRWRIKTIPSAIWNCSIMPPPSEARIVHFKGGHKARMEPYFYSGLWQKNEDAL